MSVKLKVKLRVKAMRVAAAWLLSHVDKNSELRGKFLADTFNFIASLSQRSGSYVAMDRDFAERFVKGWKMVLPPMLLLQERPCSGIPESGEIAIAEIVIDIQEALNRGRGRPSRIDALQAFEVNERHKLARHRNSRGVSSKLSYELTMDELGINNKDVISKAIRKGFETTQNIERAKSALPAGAEILFVLTDSSDGGESGVLVAQVNGCKQDVD